MADVDAWMPLWIGDYLADTGDLSTEEHGAYLLLLMASWRSGGKLPVDPAKLCRVAKVAPKRWPAIWAAIDRFFDISGDSVTQGRLVLELDIALGKKDRARTRGLKGAQARHRTRIEQAGNKQTSGSQQEPVNRQTPEEQDPKNGQPLRGDGDLRSGSPPDPIFVSDPGAIPALWPALRWKELYGRAWIAKYGGLHYGMGDGDARGIARLGDLLDEMPEIERIGAQVKSAAMFSEFLASTNPANVSARHPFAFFVTVFGGLRVDAKAAKKTPNGFPRSEYPEVRR